MSFCLHFEIDVQSPLGNSNVDKGRIFAYCVLCDWCICTLLYVTKVASRKSRTNYVGVQSYQGIRIIKRSRVHFLPTQNLKIFQNVLLPRPFGLRSLRFRKLICFFLFCLSWPSQVLPWRTGIFMILVTPNVIWTYPKTTPQGTLWALC